MGPGHRDLLSWFMSAGCTCCPVLGAHKSQPPVLSTHTAAALGQAPGQSVHLGWATVSKWSPCLQTWPFHCTLHRVLLLQCKSDVMRALWQLRTAVRMRSKPLRPSGQLHSLPSPSAPLLPHMNCQHVLYELSAPLSALPFTWSCILLSYLSNSFNKYLLGAFFYARENCKLSYNLLFTRGEQYRRSL